MFGGLNNDYLYTAVLIEAIFSNGVRSDEKPLSGTGFFLTPSPQKIILITNRHVLDLEYEDQKWRGYTLKQLKLKLRVRAPNNMPHVIATQTIDFTGTAKIVVDDLIDNDVAGVEVPIDCFSVSNQVRATNPGFFIPLSLLASESEYLTAFEVGDLVAFPGFPEWYDSKNFRPIMRIGTLASDPRYTYSFNEKNGDCIAYEAFSFGGSSGSPVFALQRGFGGDLTSGSDRRLCLIGVNAGHLKVKNSESRAAHSAHSGISYMYTTSCIRRILDKIGKN